MASATKPNNEQKYSLEGIRVLIFQESSQKGRVGVFDTHHQIILDTEEQRRKAVQTLDSYNKPKLNAEPKKNLGLTTAADRQILEMMFGSIPISNTSTTKMHYLHERRKVLLTKLFKYIYQPDQPVRNNSTNNLKNNNNNNNNNNNLNNNNMQGSNSSSSSSSQTTTSGARNFPQQRARSGSVTISPSQSSAFNFAFEMKSSDDINNNYNSTTSTSTSTNNDSNNSNLNNTNSVNNSNNSNTKVYTTSRSYFTPQQRIKTNFAVGIIVDLMEESDIIESMIGTHYTLIEYYVRIIVNAIQLVLENIARAKDDFPDILSTSSFGSLTSIPKLENISLPFLTQNALQSQRRLIDATRNLQHCIHNLITLPRLTSPIWLNIVSNPKKRKDNLKRFLEQLSHLYSYFEKNSRRPLFLSLVISAILQYHLSWIKSLSSSSSSPHSSSSSSSSALFPPTADLSTESAFEAQLNSVYGCVNSPTSPFCRIIVAGSNVEISKRLLHVLSYFIRCNEVCVYNNMFTADNPLRILRTDDVTTRNHTSLHNNNNNNNNDDTYDNRRDSNCLLDDEDDEDEEEMPRMRLDVVELSYDSRASVNPTSSPHLNMGRSLFGSHCRRYCNDFVLMGLPPSKLPHLPTLLQPNLENYYRYWNSSGDMTVHSASCIVVDIDNLLCDVYTYDPKLDPRDPLFSRSKIISPSYSTRSFQKPSMILANAIELVCNFWRMSIAADICIMGLEDAIQEIFNKSELLRSYLLENNPTSASLTVADVAQKLNFPSKFDAEMFAIIQHHLGSPISHLLKV